MEPGGRDDAHGPGRVHPEIALTGAAEAFRALHVPGRPVVLPNAWDAASARAVEAAGFLAVATSSAALAASLGFDDGEDAPAAEVFAAIGRIARAVSVPVTADVERGYGLAAAELATRLAEAGAVGCNLEDSDPRSGEMLDPSAQADLLAAVREASGADLVINARIDLFLRQAGDPAGRVADAVRRAEAYRAAGADCVYPIGLGDPAAISAVVAVAPVNASSRPDAGAVADLTALDVARISFGPQLFRVLQGRLVSLLGEISGS